MKNSIFGILFFLTAAFCHAQEAEFTSTEVNINSYINGTLVTSTTSEQVPLVIMLPGSGPTDRNGNQSFLKNDGLKKLALALAEDSIATYRFDKRILHAQRLGIKEKEMRFDDFITDAVNALDHFKENSAFSKIVVLGHSQGSLVGMIAARDKADAFISIAGLAQPVDSMLTRQIANQIPGLKENVQTAFQEMRTTGSTTSYNPVLESIFRPAVQPFLLSWIKYDPKLEISKLNIPVLIINGSNDLQVDPAEAEALKDALSGAQLVILEDMNHILRKIEGDDLENNKSYNEAQRPLHPELAGVISEFIKSL